MVILRDVLDYSAAETAVILDTTATAVNSSLQRARARLGAVAPLQDELDEPTDAARRELLDRYVAAFENADVAALTRVLTDDAVLEMPPMTNWYAGRENFGRFIARVYAIRGTDWRMVATTANGQPAFVAYVRGADGVYHLHTLQVFTLTAAGISRSTVFQDARSSRSSAWQPFCRIQRHRKSAPASAGLNEGQHRPLRRPAFRPVSGSAGAPAGIAG